MSKSKNHANHNRELSSQLFQDAKFLDWANTTAFYAAFHYVHSKLLPGNYQGVECHTIEDVQKVLKCKGKHEATSQMVAIGAPSISTSYSFLMNCSFTARYVDYQVHPEHAKLCQKFLDKVAHVCG